MLVSNRMEVGKQPEANYRAAVSKEDGSRTVQQNPVSSSDKEIEVSLSEEHKRGAALTEEELNCALENILSSESGIMDVEQADEMIRAANKNILNHANEAVLTQANQTAQMVQELSK